MFGGTAERNRVKASLNAFRAVSKLSVSPSGVRTMRGVYR
jgi:hypothetical protein